VDRETKRASIGANEIQEITGLPGTGEHSFNVRGEKTNV